MSQKEKEIAMPDFNVDVNFNVFDSFGNFVGKFVPGYSTIGLELMLGLFFILGPIFILYAVFVLPFELLKKSKIEYKKGNKEAAKKLLRYPKIVLGFFIGDMLLLICINVILPLIICGARTC